MQFDKSVRLSSKECRDASAIAFEKNDSLPTDTRHRRDFGLSELTRKTTGANRLTKVQSKNLT